jgi:hypothetical protein
VCMFKPWAVCIDDLRRDGMTWMQELEALEQTATPYVRRFMQNVGAIAETVEASKEVAKKRLEALQAGSMQATDENLAAASAYFADTHEDDEIDILRSVLRPDFDPDDDFGEADWTAGLLKKIQLLCPETSLNIKSKELMASSLRIAERHGLFQVSSEEIKQVTPAFAKGSSRTGDWVTQSYSVLKEWRSQAVPGAADAEEKKKEKKKQPLPDLPAEPVRFVDVEQRKSAEELLAAMLPALTPHQETAFRVVAGTLEREHRKLYHRNFAEIPSLRLYIAGQAGTGKSFLIGAIRELFAQWTHKPWLLVTATTGIAAYRVRGQTIHAAAGLNSRDKKKAEKKAGPLTKLSSVKRSQLLSAKFLLIDEISFMSCELLSALDERLRTLRDSKQPFGGMHLIFVGDFFQLEPPGGRVALFDGELAMKRGGAVQAEASGRRRCVDSDARTSALRGRNG